MDHVYRIEGNINGRSLLGLGTGKTDPATGVSEMEVSFEKLPDGWDPRTIVLMCCDRAVVMASRETDGAVGMYRASGGYLTIGRDLVNGLRWGIMRDRDGLVMIDVRASSVTDFRHDSRYDHSRVEGGVSHLRRGVNGISNVRPFEGVMVQAGPKLITVTTNYEAVLEDGSTLFTARPSTPTTYPTRRSSCPACSCCRSCPYNRTSTANACGSGPNPKCHRLYLGRPTRCPLASQASVHRPKQPSGYLRVRTRAGMRPHRPHPKV